MSAILWLKCFLNYLFFILCLVISCSRFSNFGEFKSIYFGNSLFTIILGVSFSLHYCWKGILELSMEGSTDFINKTDFDLTSWGLLSVRLGIWLIVEGVRRSYILIIELRYDDDDHSPISSWCNYPTLSLISKLSYIIYSFVVLRYRAGELM